PPPLPPLPTPPPPPPLPVSPSPSLPLSPSPRLPDFLAEGRQLLIIGGKGGVGKTTVAAALGWGIAQRHPEKQIRIISIDPAHSLGDAFGQPLSHEPQPLAPNLSGQEIDADIVLNQFREDYLWQLAEMMSGDSGDTNNPISIAYGPPAWRQIVSQSLPGIDELLSLIEVMAQLERGEQDLIIIDAAPTGHLLRFLEMPSALSDWLAWIFKLWLKYQDVLGRVEFMGSLRQLRQKVVKAQKQLQDPEYTEFIGVMGAEPAILAEAERLTASLLAMGISQRYIVHNRYCPGVEIDPDLFSGQTLVRLPLLPLTVLERDRIVAAANLLLSGG
ncbi:MAG TPA: ArsA family ATPase, partial [Oscillatoriaceae cyanobacterium M33_DOE_052]|nr:ArsA family ATPase [Oscillatoriaceae cyanobacterium M33_DOE_052]